jgi:ribosomal-protein-alanine N-acetyltransferase
MLVKSDKRSEPDLRLAAVLADIHAAAFAGMGRSWSAPEMLALLSEPVVAVCLAHRDGTLLSDGLVPAGFALYRTVAGEAELLTIAVMPDARRKGLGADLLVASEDGARTAGAERLFLEVAAGNAAARALYKRAGYGECGRRKDYYHSPDGGRDDAVVMEKQL